MLNILISGACGAMGKNVYLSASQHEDIKVTAGVDKFPQKLSFPVYENFESVTEPVDVVIDFSNVSSLDGMLAFALKRNIPVVIATTGYNEKQLAAINDAAKKIPVFKTANFSVGVNVLCALVKKAAEFLGEDYDIEIIEKHHHNKLDAPSGTALMLADTANSVFDDKLNYEYDRHSKRAKRTKSEIGIHSIRGGSIVGEHDVLFAGENEVVTLSHNAESRAVFAGGSIRAARFIVGKAPGMYDMTDVLNLK